ncbi:unnamed protein product [Adineta steineri]|uniref:Neurite outgrowth-associated protein n=1 Tax=Adineta steineri TaxID=433720 RepID=A0A814Z2E6_9BILA|nr:unnamed protein product [Adineta steineri]
MFFSNLNQKLFKISLNSIISNKRYVRNGQRQSTILDNYANIYRPEVESQLENLAIQTTKNKSLQINYEIDQQRKRQNTVRYHILKRKYVVHPNDIKVDPYVKNHMQFLHKNYPKRWTAEILAESFNQSVDNVRLILQQRTRRRMRVRPRPPTTLFGIKDEEEREKLVRDHIIQRDIGINNKPDLVKDDDEEPVDYQILAEESNLVSQKRPSDIYMKRDNDGFFSNIISSSDEDQQNERDISIKKKLLTSSSTSTLLDRINKLRINTNITSDTYSYDQTSEIYDKRMAIIQKMQQTNDTIVEMNEKKQKFLKKSPVKK